MKKSYYIFNPGRMCRKDNTLQFTAYDEQGKTQTTKYLPIETVENLFIFGSIDANSALFNFLAQHQVSVHFFDYYQHYTGSFMPKEYLLAGKVQVAQTQHYLLPSKRLHIAKTILKGAAANMLKNLHYYNNRDKDTTNEIELMRIYTQKIPDAQNISELMGLEGNIRQTYYQAFDTILNDFSMNGRSKQPPKNEVNALISFGNMMCYTACLDAIYHTQLNPTISFLHEPGYRRFSLSLDIAEIFKPLIVDRLIFKVLNKKILQPDDFDHQLNGILLKPAAKQKFVKYYDERLTETIQHRTLNRKVSYKHLIKLECYKLVKHILDIETYKSFKMWW